MTVLKHTCVIEGNKVIIEPLPLKPAEPRLAQDSQTPEPPTSPILTPAQIESEIKVIQDREMAIIEVEKQQLFAAARQDGFDKGMAEADLQLQQKSGEILDTVNAIVTEKNQLLHRAAEDMKMLCIGIAEKIIHEELALSPDSCLAIVSDAIQRITDTDSVAILANKHDIDSLKANQSIFLEQMPDIKKLSIREDNMVQRGGCIIETNLGYVDARLDVKLDTLKHLFNTSKPKI